MASPEARRKACVFIEVLSGIRGPCEASELLSVSLPRYYALEAMALKGLLQALEPREKGRGRSTESRLDEVSRERDRLAAELERMRSLVRLSRRAVGLPSGKKSAKAKGRPARKRRKASRNRKVLALLKTPAVEAPEQPG
jgi:hypothetical protein